MGTAALVSDYLFLGPLLQARLLDQVADLPVDVVETMDQVLASDKREAVVMVMWAGDFFDDSAAAGRSQMLRQRWLAILALNNASPQLAARQLRAGPLMSQLHKALAGWQPPDVPTTFKRANAALRPDINKVKALYPLGFEIRLSL